MKKFSISQTVISIIVIILIILGVRIIINNQTDSDIYNGQAQNTQEEREVQSLIEAFGAKLKNVPLSGETETLKQSLTVEYGDFITAELLNRWLNNPTTAPGRLTSSPWPEKIEVESVKKNTDASYTVQAKVIYITSVEVTQGGQATVELVTLEVKKENNQWKISDYSKYSV